MTPATIIVGRIQRERLAKDLNDGEGIFFAKPPQISLVEKRGNAVLVVLEPDQSPTEAAEAILWALR